MQSGERSAGAFALLQGMEAELLKKALHLKTSKREGEKSRCLKPCRSQLCKTLVLRADALGATGGRDGCGIQLGAVAAARPLLVRAALKPRVLLPCQNKLGVEAVRANLHLSALCPPCCCAGEGRLCSHRWLLGSPPKPGDCPCGARWS